MLSSLAGARAASSSATKPGERAGTKCGMSGPGDLPSASSHQTYAVRSLHGVPSGAAEPGCRGCGGWRATPMPIRRLPGSVRSGLPAGRLVAPYGVRAAVDPAAAGHRTVIFPLRVCAQRTSVRAVALGLRERRFGDELPLWPTCAHPCVSSRPPGLGASWRASCSGCRAGAATSRGASAGRFVRNGVLGSRASGVRGAPPSCTRFVCVGDLRVGLGLFLAVRPRRVVGGLPGIIRAAARLLVGHVPRRGLRSRCFGSGVTHSALASSVGWYGTRVPRRMGAMPGIRGRVLRTARFVPLRTCRPMAVWRA